MPYYAKSSEHKDLKMTKKEIFAGIKNAIERGETLEQAKQTFINAGYSKEEVEEAVASLGRGVITKFPEPSEPKAPEVEISEKIPELPPKKSKKRTLIIILIIIFIILLGFLAASYFLKEEIINFLKNIFT